MSTKKKEESKDKCQTEVRDANICMAIGAGVGAMGIGSAALLGAVCPACVFVAPALLGIGAVRRGVYKKKLEEIEKGESAEEITQEK